MGEAGYFISDRLEKCKGCAHGVPTDFFLGQRYTSAAG